MSFHGTRARGFGSDIESLYSLEGNNGMISIVGVSLW